MMSKTPVKLFLMDGNVINNFNGQQPLLWLSGGSNATYEFWRNNYYGSTLLDTAGKITGLGSNIIRLQSGATLTMIP